MRAATSQSRLAGGRSALSPGRYLVKRVGVRGRARVRYLVTPEP